MADITMCKDDVCPLRNTCYRFTAPPSPQRQSYFSETPRLFPDDPPPVQGIHLMHPAMISSTICEHWYDNRSYPPTITVEYKDEADHG